MRMGLNLGLNGSTAFSPASLFAGGRAGGWWQPSPDTAFTDVSATTAAGVGDSAAYTSDRSGNGIHWTQGTPGARPILRVDGNGKYYLETDGTDDHMEFSGTWTADMDLMVGVKITTPDTNARCIFGSNLASVFTGAYDEGSTSTFLSNIVGAVVYVDGVSQVGVTRDDMYTALAVGGATFEVQSMDLTSPNYATMQFPGYGGTSFFAPMAIYSMVFCEGMTATEIAQTRAYIAATMA